MSERLRASPSPRRRPLDPFSWPNAPKNSRPRRYLEIDGKTQTAKTRPTTTNGDHAAGQDGDHAQRSGGFGSGPLSFTADTRKKVRGAQIRRHDKASSSKAAKASIGKARRSLGASRRHRRPSSEPHRSSGWLSRALLSKVTKFVTLWRRYHPEQAREAHL